MATLIRRTRAHGTVTSGPENATIGEAGPEVVAPVRSLFGRLGRDIAGTVVKGMRRKPGGMGGNMGGWAGR